MNKRLENKISRWYDKSVGTRVWLAKHWHRWITYGCSMCWTDKCSHSFEVKNIDSPKGYGEMAEYCYDNYGNPDETR
jgi:hypothetical protein